jgi:small-conductance mechanosensitive channel
MDKFLEQVLLGNTLRQWSVCILIVVSLCFLLKVFSRVALSRFKAWSQKTNTKLDDYAGELIEKILLPFAYIAAIYVGISTLQRSEQVQKYIHVAFVTVATFFVARLFASMIRRFILNFIESQPEAESRRKQASGIIILVNIVVFVFGFIFLVDNLGYNISTVITGLGIGGIAIALAAQTILGDLFSYFVIFFDKPFEIGDFIKIGDDLGSIEHIGIKTTRIRTITGEQMICSNTQLTGSRIRNFKRMERRRVVQKIGLVYQTPAIMVKQVPEILKKIIEAKPDVIFDRAHFSEFGDFSLNFEYVFFVLSSDYYIYMDRLQQINFDILQEFEKSKIEFAYPTQTIYSVNGNKGSISEPSLRKDSVSN